MFIIDFVVPASPNTKLGLRMTTLHEEQTHNSLSHEGEREECSEEEGGEEEVQPSAKHQPLRFTEIDSVS